MQLVLPSSRHLIVQGEDMELTDITVAAVFFVVTALAAPLALAGSFGEDLQEGAEQHQYDRKKEAADKERDARKLDQPEQGSCGAAD